MWSQCEFWLCHCSLLLTKLRVCSPTGVLGAGGCPQPISSGPVGMYQQECSTQQGSQPLPRASGPRACVWIPQGMWLSRITAANQFICGDQPSLFILETSVSDYSAYPHRTWPQLACYQAQNQKQFFQMGPAVCAQCPSSSHSTLHPHAASAACQGLNSGCAQELQPGASPQHIWEILCPVQLLFSFHCTNFSLAINDCGASFLIFTLICSFSAFCQPWI